METNNSIAWWHQPTGEGECHQDENPVDGQGLTEVLEERAGAAAALDDLLTPGHKRHWSINDRSTNQFVGETSYETSEQNKDQPIDKASKRLDTIELTSRSGN